MAPSGQLEPGAGREPDVPLFADEVQQPKKLGDFMESFTVNQARKQPLAVPTIH